MIQQAQPDTVIRFAEKILELLDEGRFVSTYKFAVLLALMDLCFEKNAASGMQPESVTTRQLAEKIIEIYWPHTVDYHSISAVLKQNNGRQAEIPAAILRFRREIEPKSTDLSILAEDVEWERDPKKTEAAARALYLRLHSDARLWMNGRRFVHPDFPRLRLFLSG